jgi:pimeloyl-ACP methyl ester carboxylesterase
MTGTVYRFGRQQTKNEDVEIEYYEVLKPGATKDFIFLVGLMSHAQETGGIEEFLHTRNCYFVTHRSHYGSDYHPDLNYDLMADDVLRFMNKKGMKKVTMGGLCFGARAAMKFASKYPERLDGLVIVEATVGNYEATDGVSPSAWKSLDYAAAHLTLRQYKEWANYMSDAMNYDGWK